MTIGQDCHQISPSDGGTAQNDIVQELNSHHKEAASQGHEVIFIRSPDDVEVIALHYQEKI